MSANGKKALGIRLDDELYAILQQEARGRDIPPTTLAGLLLQEALQHAGGEDHEQQLGSILAAVERLERELPRRVVATMLEALPAVKPARPPRRNGGMNFADFLASEDDTEPDEHALEE